MKWSWSKGRSAGGFDQNVLRDINNLKEILERYEGRAWFKEVVQNADDAGATRLDVGWVSRLPGISHPLLRGGPAVFVLNNGPFTARDAVAIHQLGLSDKASDRSSIGRFGLGLKSLFHWCEAYFYLSSGHSSFADAGNTDNYPPIALFNPWNGPSRVPYHEDWNEFEEADKSRILEYLGGLGLLPDRDWFCLWVPLRRPDTCGWVHPISERYPGKDGEGWAGIIPQDLPNDLAILPPLLRELRTIRGWADEGGTAELRSLFELQFVEGSTRRHYRPDRDEDRPFRATWGGKIRTLSAPRGWDLVHDYTGVERLLTDDPAFDRLRNRVGWPRSFGPADDSTGQSRQEPTKAAPHVAVYFTRRPCNQDKGGRLIVRWAAFLPVGEEPAEVVEDLGGDSDFILVLHGDFFVDAGRKNVDFPSEPRTVSQEWNARLRDYGTLPLVLSALEQLAASVGVSSESLQRVTKALANTTLFKKHRERICDGRRWIFRVDKGMGRWALVDADHEVYEIPSSPITAPGLHVEVLPRLVEAVAERRHVTFLNHPRLEPATARISDWPEDLLLTLLDVPVAEVFAHEDRLTYLVGLLERALTRPVLSPSLADRLCGLAHAAFDLVGTRQLSRLEAFGRFLALILSERRIELDVASIDGVTVESLFRTIAGCHLHCVLVPIGLDPCRHDFWVLQQAGRPSGRNLGLEDAEKILPVLAGLSTESILPNRRSGLACQILEALGDNARHLNGKCDDLCLFLGRANADSDEQLLSRRELAQARDRGLLFVGELGLARPLQAVLRGRDVAVADARTVELLFGRQHVRRCDAQACLATLRSEPRLTDAEAPRIALLAVICTGLAQRPIGADRQSLRYLIHGRRERRENEATLFAGAVPGLSPVWRQLARRALQVSDGGWRNVDPEVIRHLTGDQQEALGVLRYDLESVLRLLREVGPHQIDLQDFSDGDRDAILRECRAEHAEVVRGLRIHRTCAGHYVAIDNRSYWLGNFAVPDDLPGEIVLLRPSDDPVLSVKQRQIHDLVLDAEQVIRIILERPGCENRWRTITGALLTLGEVPRDLKDKLSTTRWIPSGVKAVAPEEVIRIVQPLDERIREVLAAARPGPDALRGVALLSLPEPFHDHKVLEKIYPDRDGVRNRGLSRLGAILAGDERFRIGPFEPNNFDINGFLEVFRAAPEEVMPCHSLIEDICGKSSPVELRSRLLPNLMGVLTESRMVAILDHLSERAVPRDWHNKYLRAAGSMHDFATILPRIRLLNQRGKWKRAEDLSLDADGIDTDFLLDVDQAEAIGERVSHAHVRAPDSAPCEERGKVNDLDRRIELGIDALEAQVRSWSKAQGTPPQIIGGFVAFLGDHPRIRQLAEEYLEHMRIDAVRETLEWSKLLKGNVPYVRGDVHGMMMDQEFVFEVTASKTVPVLNLLGQRVERAISKSFEHLLLGVDYLDHRPGGRRVDLLRVREVEPNHLPSGATMATVLRETTRRLLDLVYWQKAPNLDDLWDGFSRGDQLEIQVAQNLILKSIFAYVRQLGLHGQARVRELLAEWDQAQVLEAQADHGRSQGRDLPQARKDAVKTMENATHELKDLLEHDPDTHRQFLNAVRVKIRQFQYDEDSVPFELFQNADDAAVELRQMMGADSLPEGSRRFMAWADADVIRFVHGGRPINRFRLGNFDGRNRGFDRDLQKMLMLSSSDKAPGSVAHGTTGRFGLGFKSAFLLSDAPRVLSGRLAFEVVAGLFPRALDDDERKALERCVQELGSTSDSATLIELPLHGSQGSGDRRGEPIERFALLAHLQVVFARHIRRCVVRLRERRPVSVVWEESPVPGVQGAFVGTLCPAVEEAGRSTTALALRSEVGAMLLALSEVGFGRLGADIPTTWVTAPTRERPGLGFAVNADFELDAGRAQLARDPSQNHQKVDVLGAAMGRILCDLYDTGQGDWGRLSASLQLGADVNPAEVWSSLWHVLGLPLVGSEGPTADLMRRMLWGRVDQGMALLLDTRDALPTKLPGEHERLTRLSRATHATAGLLDLEQVFGEVARWPRFRAAYAPGVLIAGSVREALRRLMAEAVSDYCEVTLTEAVRNEVGPNLAVDPDLADLMGVVVTPEFLRQTRQGKADRDRDKLLDLLTSLRFQAGDGRWYEAVVLLIDAKDGSEEAMRAGFAPDDRILSPSYRGAGFDFVRACRPGQQMKAGVKELANWARFADDFKRRKWVIDFLVSPFEMSVKVVDDLYADRQDSWLKRLGAHSAPLTHLPSRLRDSLLGRLGLASSPPQPPPSQPPPPPGRVLAEIHDWWMANRDESIRRYEEMIYPDGHAPNWPADGLSDDEEARRGWMILLSLGAMHTLGRTRPWQDSGFLRLCRDHGWLDTFARPTEQLDSWMEVLVEYLQDQVQHADYFLWMSRFVGLFQLSHWLPEYAELFLRIDGRREPFQLGTLLTPRADMNSPADAPPLTKVLGIGACFVARELARAEVINPTNPQLQDHCYPPVGRVRKLLIELGCTRLGDPPRTIEERLGQSRIIHEFLCQHIGPERAHFGHTFDLPLLEVADDRELKARFLGQAGDRAEFDVQDDETEADPWRQ